MTTRLRRFLDERKWTLDAFALRVTAALPSKYANGKRRPRITPSMAAKWAKGHSTPTLENALAIQVVCGDDVPLSSLLVRR